MKSSVVRSAGSGSGSSRGRGRLRGWQQRSDAGSHRHGGRPEHDDAAAQQQLHPPGRHAELGRRVRAAVHAVRRGSPRLEDRAEDHPRRRDNPGAGAACSRRRGSGRAPDCANVDSFVVPQFIDQGALQPIDEYFTQEEKDDLFPFVRDVVIGDDGKMYAAWWCHGPAVAVPQDRPGARGAEDLGRAA